ncbi:hypothetical protein M427DRAFT_459260 [Gonapodya prolifera JEL478]|uniref:Uncharacterized protein n=1 Tax=Gonapodya prolifera (strain JEL478) TaxID=1344416 RepID=A0A139A261_GONPJ|nr:hypothetical protein M427DRAFT_459260 [Gonapodya prolifera JEL478]|eukprot:KXS10876.1 hypothetical protein M427DRAFT_459260 [Gonapodya prolifera JEL478]
MLHVDSVGPECIKTGKPIHEKSDALPLPAFVSVARELHASSGPSPNVEGKQPHKNARVRSPSPTSHTPSVQQHSPCVTGRLSEDRRPARPTRQHVSAHAKPHLHGLSRRRV